VELAQVEQVSDQARELEPAALHGRERRPLGLGERAVLPLEQRPERREDQGERRLQLVGEVGEELALEAVQALELPVGALQAARRLLARELRAHLLALGAVREELAR